MAFAALEEAIRLDEAVVVFESNQLMAKRSQKNLRHRILHKCPGHEKYSLELWFDGQSDAQQAATAAEMYA